MLEIIRNIDHQLFFWVNNGLQNAFFDLLCPFMRKQSNWYLLYAVVCYFLYERYRAKSLWLILSAAVLILVTDQLCANLIKNIVQRLRPCNNPELKEQVRMLVHCGSGYSFVSAHAANHFAIAVFISSFFKEIKWAKPVALVWAALIAFSQVYVGVHFPLDIFAGALIGSALGYFMYKFMDMRKSFNQKSINHR